MANPSLTRANRLLDESARLTTGEATRFLFDHYRCSRQEAQEAFVLALIGSVLTSRAMRAAGVSCLTSPANSEVSS